MALEKPNSPDTKTPSIEKKENPLDNITSMLLKDVLKNRNGKYKEITGFEYNGSKIDPITISREGNTMHIDGLFGTLAIEKNVNADGGLAVLGLDDGKEVSRETKPVDFKITIGETNSKGTKFMILTKKIIKTQTTTNYINYTSSGDVLNKEANTVDTVVYFNDQLQNKLNAFLSYCRNILEPSKIAGK